MRPTFLALALSISSWPAFSAEPQITDPAKFVAGVYQHFVEAQTADRHYNAPANIYTPRLAKLFRHDKEKAKGEVGCLDSDFWVDGQDWKITNLTVTSGGVALDRNVVVAKFINLGTATELHFDFRRIDQRWLLDDVHSTRDPRWTLSEILKCEP
jgi:hypothetical protein